MLKTFGIFLQDKYENEDEDLTCQVCQMQFWLLPKFNEHVKKEHSREEILKSEAAIEKKEIFCRICETYYR